MPVDFGQIWICSKFSFYAFSSGNNIRQEGNPNPKPFAAFTYRNEHVSTINVPFRVPQTPRADRSHSGDVVIRLKETCGLCQVFVQFQPVVHDVIWHNIFRAFLGDVVCSSRSCEQTLKRRLLEMGFEGKKRYPTPRARPEARLEVICCIQVPRVEAATGKC